MRGLIMEKNNNNGNVNSMQPTQVVDRGRWVPVDEKTLGFSLPPLPSQKPVAGPDGAIYCVGDSKPQLGRVGNNTNNAVPVPSSIVQMPAIVQPIALVPYTSQNQPMLQYDPYSRPVEPKTQPKAPVYVKKPYKAVSASALILSVIALVLLLILSVASFQTNDSRQAFEMNGVDSIMAIGDIFGFSSGSEYSQYIVANKGTMDTLSKIVVYAFPILITLITLVFVGLVIKYLARFLKKKSPRSFSIAALINIVFVVLAFAGLLAMSNSEVETSLRSTNVSDFFSLGDAKATIEWGWGLLVALCLSIVLLFVPLFARKNAYIVEKDDPSKKTYVIDD